VAPARGHFFATFKIPPLAPVARVSPCCGIILALEKAIFHFHGSHPLFILVGDFCRVRFRFYSPV
jgi:hypothetical protein